MLDNRPIQSKSTVNEGTRWSESHPELGTGPVPLDSYTSREHFELEAKYLFGRTWIHVGRVEEIPNPGDYYTKDLAVPKVMLLVVRGNDGAVRAFHNVCAHRCNRVLSQPSGCASRLRCQFHGWTYDLQGKLIGLPDRSQFHAIRTEDYGLTPINCDVWEGFIFINLDPKPQQMLRDFVGEQFHKLEGYPWAKMKSVFSYSAEVNCNWKVALDAFQEAYHVAFVHAQSIRDKLGTPENRLLHPLSIEINGNHRKLSLEGNLATVYGNPGAIGDEQKASKIKPAEPIEAAALRYGVPAMRKVAADIASTPLPEGMNPTKSPIWAFDINVLFPNFYLSMRPNYFMAYNFRPVAVDKTFFDARIYYPRADSAAGRFYQEYMKVVLRDVFLEDWGTTEDVQHGASTGAKSHMVLQENEILVRHTYQSTRAYIEAQQERDKHAHSEVK